MLKFKELAEEIASVEGKKQEVNIAQISEILRITLDILSLQMNCSPFGTMAFLGKRFNSALKARRF